MSKQYNWREEITKLRRTDDTQMSDDRIFDEALDACMPITERAVEAERERILKNQPVLPPNETQDYTQGFVDCNEGWHEALTPQEEVTELLEKPLEYHKFLNAERKHQEELVREYHRNFEPDIKLAKSLRKDGYENLALWIETKNFDYLKNALTPTNNNK